MKECAEKAEAKVAILLQALKDIAEKYEFAFFNEGKDYCRYAAEMYKIAKTTIKTDKTERSQPISEEKTSKIEGSQPISEEGQ